MRYTLTCSQLRILFRKYVLKTKGTKRALFVHLLAYLSLCVNAVLIQKSWRRFLLGQFLKRNRLYTRSACVNTTDCATLTELTKIHPGLYFGYVETADQNAPGMEFGFSVETFHRLIHTPELAVNPYTRKPISPEGIIEFNRVYAWSKMLFPHRHVRIVQDDAIIINISVEARAIELFHTMYLLDNYVDHIWFMHLSRIDIEYFLYVLYDIWYFRFSLDAEMQQMICEPHGRPIFASDLDIVRGYIDTESLQHKALDIIHNFINRGRNIDARRMGAFYVISALTLVSDDAASAFPWLYENMINTNIYLHTHLPLNSG